jgi:hypothetical protein
MAKRQRTLGRVTDMPTGARIWGNHIGYLVIYPDGTRAFFPKYRSARASAKKSRARLCLLLDITD